MSNMNRRSFLGQGAALAGGLGILSNASASSTIADSQTLADFPNLKQPDDISCGPTCACMVLRWYGVNAGLERCKTKSGTRWFELGEYKVGMTLPSGVSDCLDSFGVPSRHVIGTTADVMRYVDQNRPPILLVRSGVKTWHWVVVSGYSQNGAVFSVSDPSGERYDIKSSTLDAAWTFSHDLAGQATGGRRCSPCGGSGKLASARVTCTNCAGSGKMISNLQVKKCGKCDGSGKINVPGGECLVCSGSGNSPDMYRKVVESAKVSGHTLVVPNRGKLFQVEYTIKNDAGRTVNFQMQPSGKSYSLEAGRTFTGKSNEVNGKDPTITITDTGKTYRLTPGNHKFWWMKDEKRVGLDLNAK